ncbi:MAG: hypothetical protein G01um101444_176 [Parcubacteria group bacterium Gr01-1014_44]|nr:MAG: hypothetical protein G01um101444_176 [Parcubacteria group bacterium Gr01-1014_44]
MKIAVVGAGIFGISAAVKLAQNSHRVDLFEKEDGILKAASGINQFRLHRGFHYPRSSETTGDSIRTEKSFRLEYGQAVIDDGEQYYGIAKEGSLISADTYLDFCQKFKLGHEHIKPAFLNHSQIDLCLRAKEGRIDHAKLKKICLSRIKKLRVNLRLETKATPGLLKNYDLAVLCAYANLNSLLLHVPDQQKKYQFELCEKPVVKLPRQFTGKSLVMMDGPFMCLDPLGGTDKFLLGNVVHAIHQSNIGLHPEVDDKFLPILNKGIIKNPPITNFKKFIESGVQFIPELAKAEHIGSMFTIRTVLPHKEETDERPTIVSRINDKTITVFSGKFSNCVEAAEKVLEMVKEV